MSVVSPATLFGPLLKKFFKDARRARRPPTMSTSARSPKSSAASTAPMAAARRSARPTSRTRIPPPSSSSRTGSSEDAYVCRARRTSTSSRWKKDLWSATGSTASVRKKLRLPKQVANAMVTRLKIMCDLDISERRLPQDDARSFQTVHEEEHRHRSARRDRPDEPWRKVVMRILDKTTSTLPLPALGFSEENLASYRECIRQPYGMILHCGPTGSGKSMTLYSALGEVNTPDVNIQTAEDPIEYTLAGSTRCR